MSDSPASPGGLDAVASGDALIGMATLGKTAAALALIVVIILVASAVLKRVGVNRQAHGGRLRVVGGTSVGNRERVVIVQVEETWLVLGVGGGQVSKLHELPAPAPSGETTTGGGPAFAEGDGFATRFAKALKHNSGLGRETS
ncbi:flagellar biosynthetic protein FliO [Halomonas heilongjiangensis]|uniref:Flagellar protein n=1 Tax=Halomonas heilongjiangensis TaxID=1387883 RepID=A0A2N7TQP2_9GAMM|nr:flagellar biosynthetic protein FliO [Halomonas heilongjiangensis]PMR70502.1 flagellar biosynthetic protein FliO [Halomonas heilongjiangensis]PXX92909.1 flagellar biosynthetic protein FliO [Halomonas heilongjiangensis]